MSDCDKTAAGERFSKTISLTPDKVSAFATSVADDNPLHHDPAHAATTRYKRLIASGTHTTSLLMALTAEHFSKRGAVVGLEFCVRFKKPVFADETITIEWHVVSVEHSTQLKGDVVEMQGRVANEAGETAVAATGKVLIAESF